MKTIAVIVTYNRKELLKECINAVLAQSICPEEIIVVDNNSTDGTYDYLKNSKLLEKVDYLRLSKNVGCSGGVYHGIKAAYEKKADWIWVMDDDTKPTKTALERLVNPISSLKNVELCFVCSKVIWKDNKTHKVNVPTIKKYNQKTDSFYFDYWPYLQLDCCSFVSVLINSKSVRMYGLPIKEFFIWQDDIEYTKRLTHNGEVGLLIMDSVVFHQTNENYSPNVYTLDISAISKFKHECRNKIYVSREFDGGMYHFLRVIKCLLVDTVSIGIKRKDNKLIFMFANFLWVIKGIFFRPNITFVE